MEQSNLGPDCLQNKIPKCISSAQTKTAVNGWKMVKCN